METDVTDPYLAAPPARHFVARFLEGAATPVRGFRYLNRNRALWQFAILPLVFNSLITTTAFLLLVTIAGWFYSQFHPWLTGGLSGVWWWLVLVAEVIVGLVLLLVAAIVAIVAWRILSGILCGYFYGQLAEHVEQQLGVGEGELRSISFVSGLIDTILNLTLLIVVSVAIVMLSLIPAAGSVLAVVCGLYFTWFMLGLDYLNMPLAMRGIRRLRQLRFAHRHRMFTIGLGSVVFLFGFVPILGGVLLTTAVVGAVLLHRRIQMYHT